jgi:Tol biopolymer transport system component
VEAGSATTAGTKGNGQTVGIAGSVASSLEKELAEEIPEGRIAGQKRKLLTIPAFAASIALAAYIGFWLRPPQPPQITGYLQITHDGLQKFTMATDGERIFMEVHGEGGRFSLEEVSAAGGESAPVPTPFEDIGLEGIARDGSALFVTNLKLTERPTATWALPLPTGAPRRIAQFGSSSVAPTPDGNRLLLSSRSELYVADSTGQNPQKILSVDGHIDQLQISPDGSRLRFTLDDTPSGSSTLWEANRDGSGAHPLFSESSDSQHECCGKWTPDGKYFVFESFRGGHSNIWVLPEGEGWWNRHAKPVQLTNGPLDFSYPVPSKDGKKIFAFGVEPRSELICYDARTGFGAFLNGMSISDVDFSRDGQWVTYVSVPERALWRSRLDGSERLQLTNPGMLSAGLPRWSPDGKRIVFMGRTLETNWRAYLISSDGGTPQDLVPEAKVGFDPTWSADGKSIALSLENLGIVSQGVTILDLETKQRTDLPDAEQLFSPRWSPDGKYIAGISTDSQKLMLFDLSTRKWSEVVKMPIGYPSWSHDSRYIYFDTLSRDPVFYRVRIADHKLEEVADLKGLRRYWGDFGEWTGITADDTPLLTLNASSQEVYALDWDHR